LEYLLEVGADANTPFPSKAWPARSAFNFHERRPTEATAGTTEEQIDALPSSFIFEVLRPLEAALPL
jgi:hypothetical protein